MLPSGRLVARGSDVCSTVLMTSPPSPAASLETHSVRSSKVENETTMKEIVALRPGFLHRDKRKILNVHLIFQHDMLLNTGLYNPVIVSI